VPFRGGFARLAVAFGGLLVGSTEEQPTTTKASAVTVASRPLALVTREPECMA
jgi:hypothetical protein